MSTTNATQANLFGLRGTPRRMVEVLESMHADSPDRWIPRRLILCNWWLFDEPQEVHFGRGNLMLTGKNESGKSTVLITIATLVLDRLIEPVRIDTTGGGDRTVRYYLVGKDSADERHAFFHQERTGYVALEFERGSSSRFRTVGFALRTSRNWENRKVRPWSFVLHEGCRVGHDLHLLSPQSKKPLREPELRAAIGERGQVFGEGQQREYQEAVNELLFGFPSLDEFHRYLDALHVLRTPKLGEGLSPARVEQLLVDSLPPVDMAPIDQAAESFQRMDTIEAEIRKLREQRDHATRLNEVQIEALEAEANRLADIYLGALGELRRRQKALDRDQASLDEARQEREDLAERIGTLRDQIAYLEGTLGELEDQISDHEAADTERRLEEVRKRRDILVRELEQLTKDLSHERDEAEKARSARAAEETRWYETISEYESRLRDLLGSGRDALWPDLEQRAAAALSEVGGLAIAGDGPLGTGLGLGTLQTESDDRKGRVQPILDAHAGVEDAEEAYQHTRDSEKRARDEYQKRDGEYSQREAELAEARERGLAFVAEWRAGFDLFVPPPESVAAVAAAIGEYQDPGQSALRMAASLRDAFEREWEAAAQEASERAFEAQRVQADIEALDGRIRRLESDPDIEPERSDSTVAARTALLEAGVPSIPLYEACAFPETMPAAVQARIEETLEAAGLLDALIVPVGLVDDAEAVLGDRGLGDRWLRPAPEGAVHPWLVPTPSATVPATSIARALATIGIGVESLPEEARTAVSRTGRWRVGDLEGLAPCAHSRVRFIGEVNRRVERDRQLAEARSERDRLRERTAALTEEVRALRGREKALREAWAAFRESAAFADVNTALVRVDQARELRKEASRNMAALGEDLQRKQEVLRSAKAALEQACGPARYLLGRSRADVERVLSALGQAVRDGQETSRVLGRLGEIRERWATAKDRIATAEQRANEFGQRIGEKEREDGALAARQQEQENLLRNQTVGRDELIQRRDEAKTKKADAEKSLRDAEIEDGRLEGDIRQLAPKVEDKTSERDRATTEKVAAESNLKQVLRVYPATAGWLDDAREMGLEKFALRRIHDVSREEIPGKAEKGRDALIQTFHQVRGAFHGLNARIEDQHMVVFTDVDGDLFAHDLVVRLEQDLAQKENALEAEDQAIIEKVFLRHVTDAIRTAISRTEDWRVRVNDLLSEMKLFQGGTLKIEWKPREKKIETDAYDPKELAELFSQTGISLREDRQDTLVQIFRDMIAVIRENAREQNLAIEYRGELLKLLDYKQWYNLEVHRKDESGRFRHLTRRVYGEGSMGRRSLDLILPLIAGVHGRLSVAAPDAPRIVGFDEAFAGVDDQNAAQIYSLLDRIGLNWVMATEKATPYGPHLSGVSTYEFLNDGRDVAPLASVWDGNAQHSFEDEDLPDLVPAEARSPGDGA